MNENLLGDLGILFETIEGFENKKYVLIHKENVGFFKEIISDRIRFQERSKPATFAYMDISDITQKDVENLREYRDYLILINGV